MSQHVVITQPFPCPPGLVASAFADLSRVQVLTDLLGGRGAEEAEAELEQFGDLDLLPRPWDPASCTPSVRAQLWPWLDDVVGWFNGEYGWKVERTIPGCWPSHPHLAHEIPLLACLRWQAGQAMTPDPLEEWHRWALPTFVDRMHAQIGTNSCPPGKHTTWPAKGRHDDYVDLDRRVARAAIFVADARPAGGPHNGGPGPRRPIAVVR